MRVSVMCEVNLCNWIVKLASEWRHIFIWFFCCLVCPGWAWMGDQKEPWIPLWCNQRGRANFCGRQTQNSVPPTFTLTLRFFRQISLFYKIEVSRIYRIKNPKTLCKTNLPLIFKNYKILLNLSFGNNPILSKWRKKNFPQSFKQSIH